MSDFKAKMHQTVCRLGRSLLCSARPPSLILGGLLPREGRGGQERRGDLLLSRYTPIHYILDKGMVLQTINIIV